MTNSKPNLSLIDTLNHDKLIVLHALALWTMPAAANRLIDFFGSSWNAFAPKNKWSPQHIKSMLTQLVGMNYAAYIPGIGYRIHPDLRHEVLWSLHGDKTLSEWVKAIRGYLEHDNAYRAWSTYSAEFCQREMMFAAFTNNLSDFGVWRSRFFSSSGKFTQLLAHDLFGTETGARLFTEIPPTLQAMALLDLFSASPPSLDDCSLAYEYAKAHFHERFKNDFILADELCTQAILRGESATFIDELIHAMGRQSYSEAILTLLRGDVAKSDAMFSQLQQDNRRPSKRRPFISGVAGYFYTIAQLANDTPDHLQRAFEQCVEGANYHPSYFYDALKLFVMHRLQGVELTPLPRRTLPISLASAFCQFAYFWQRSPTNEFDRHALYMLLTHCQGIGYIWVAAELDRLRHHQFNEPLEYPDWHAQRHLNPLDKLLQREDPWQRALKALSQLKTPQQKMSDTRIAWFVSCGTTGWINLEAREQKRSSKGVWNKGRAISIKRLARESETLPDMLELDKEIASCVRLVTNRYYHGGVDYELDELAALPHLIGHPHVYWMDAPDVRIDVVKGEIALIMDQAEEMIHLRLDPAIDADRSVAWRKQTPTRLVVYAIKAEVKQIAAILGNGLSIPSSAKEQLVTVIASIAPHLAIHSDLPELAEHIESVPADTTLFAHLLPLREGLRLQFLVRPLPEGSWLIPGKGSINILGEHKGSAIRTRRDLNAEQALLDRALNNCIALENIEQIDHEWELNDPKDCLELLSHLHDLKTELADDKAYGNLELVWPEGERFRIKSTRNVGQMRLSIKQQGDWFVAAGGIQLDDGKVIALRELIKLASGAFGRFVSLGDNNYLALTESFRRQLLELNALSDPSGKDDIKVNPLAAPILAELATEVGELKADKAWKEHLKRLDALVEYVPQLPSTFQATLRDYQLEGYQWLSRLAFWGVGACLADDMGLGKTVQTLALLLERAAHGPALVVTPTSVALNWQAESARFAPTLAVRQYHTQRSLEGLAAFDVVVTSYGLLQQDAQKFAEPHWHTIVLDEAQVIKNAATKRSQAAMRLKGDFKMIASGTPIENHLGELWNLFRFINPSLLGSQERFTERFAGPIERGDKQARHYLKRLVQPFILRRTKTQVLTELPARTEIALQVALSDQERHMYEALRQEALDSIANAGQQENTALQVLAEITKLRRFCCNPKLVIKHAQVASSKLKVFADITEELLDNHHKALVFSQFVDHLAIVREWLDEKKIPYQYLDGKTPTAERKRRVDAFQAGEGDIFLISLKAGGTGLNLTAADYVIHLDPWWNPAVEDQASDRAHRMGQQRPVTIYRLVTQHTIEDQIIALHAQKRDLADSLLEGGDVSAKLDAAALLRLLKETV